MKRSWIIFLGIGIIFLINAIFGRYLVLPGYLSSLEAGRHSVETASQTVPLWKIIRYLLWAYSFKLGIFFVGIGVLLRASIPRGRFWLIISGGILYLLLAYLPFPGTYPLFFGLGGGLMTILLIFIFFNWAKDHDRLQEAEKKTSAVSPYRVFLFCHGHL